MILAVIFITASSVLAQPKLNFKVKTDKLELKFQDISGMIKDAPVAKYRQGEITTPVKLPGIKKSSSAVCKQGIASNTKEMNDFLSSTKKTSITIELLDEQGKTTMTWVLSNAFIIKTVKAVNGKDILIESMDIAYEVITAIDINKK